MFKLKQNLNIEYGGVVIKDVCTKVGQIVGGEQGEEIGRKIDEATKNVTIRIGEENNKSK